MVQEVLGVPVHYEQYGSGKPVLCLHGFGVDHKLMTSCMEPVFRETEGYRRIYPDLPGMGRTPAAPWLQNADDMLKLLCAFVETVLPEEAFLVAGESYGGYLARGIVHAMPERVEGAFFLCAVVLANRSKRRLPEKTVLRFDEALKAYENEHELKGFLEMAVVASPELYELYKADILPGAKLADVDFLNRYSGEGYSFTFEDGLMDEVYAKPVTVVCGRQDQVVGYLDAFSSLRQFPRAAFAVFDCAGHNAQIEHKPLFQEHLKDWLRRVEWGAGKK